MWDTAASIWDSIKGLLLFFKPIVDFIAATKIQEQLENIDYKELFTNQWFLTPYLAWLAWNVYHKQFNTLIIILLFTGSWAFFGTPYMRGVLNQQELQLDTVIPLVGGACAVMGVVLYLIFFKSE